MKMQKDMVAWRDLAGWQGITTIWISMHGWCIWIPIINSQWIIYPEIKKKGFTLIKITIGKNVKRRSILPGKNITPNIIFYIKIWKIVLNHLSNWQLNFPGTIYSISIEFRKSRWCNHTWRLCDGNSTLWKWD